MGGSYKRCPGCGGRALSIATRCPGCGGEFPAAEEGGGQGRKVRLSIPLNLPVVLLAGIGVMAASRIGRMAPPREERSSFGAVVTAPDSAGARPASTAPAAVLVAQSMVPLMKARSRSAPLEAVLERGDTLTVDSLAGNWYRVTFEGAVMGYAERSNLDSLAARPTVNPPP